MSSATHRFAHVLVISLSAFVPPSAGFAQPAQQAPEMTIPIGVLRVQHTKETISILDIPADNDFLAGAHLFEVPSQMVPQVRDIRAPHGLPPIWL